MNYNKEQKLNYDRLWRAKNRAKIRIQHANWRKANPDKVKLLSDKYRTENADKKLLSDKTYRENNREKMRVARLKWIQENPEKHKACQKAYKLRNKNYKIGAYLRTRVYRALKAQKAQKWGKTEELLGCSIPDVRVYLEAKFKEGMTWDNYGKWHIDHIKPLAKFDLTNKEEQMKAISYTNLQPLWAQDNLRKSASYQTYNNRISQ